MARRKKKKKKSSLPKPARISKGTLKENVRNLAEIAGAATIGGVIARSARVGRAIRKVKRATRPVTKAVKTIGRAAAAAKRAGRAEVVKSRTTAARIKEIREGGSLATRRSEVFAKSFGKQIKARRLKRAEQSRKRRGK